MTVRAELDRAVRAYAQDRQLVEAGEVLVTWFVVAGTRTADDGGGIVTIPADDAMPMWQAKGLLVEALDQCRFEQIRDDDDA